MKKSVEPKKSASAAMLEMLSSESGSESSLGEESKGREGKRRCPPLGAILVEINSFSSWCTCAGRPARGFLGVLCVGLEVYRFTRFTVNLASIGLRKLGLL